MSIDRDFEQVSEEHMKSMTKPEGPAQEPQADPLGKWYCPKHKLRITDAYSCPECFEPVVPPTPAPSQPAGAREWLERYHGDLSRLEWPQQFPLSVLIEYLEAYARQQTAAKDAEIRELRGEALGHNEDAEILKRERDSLREALEGIAQVAASDGHIKLLSVWRIADAALKAGKE